MHLTSPPKLPTLDECTSLTDEQVVIEVLAGHTALFELLMRRHNERLYRTARAVLRGESEVEDVMQQAYLNAYCHLDQFDGRSKFSTWLTRIAVHDALSRVRARGRCTDIASEELAMPPGVMDPEHQALSRELGALLEAAIDRLPDGIREVFVLRKVEGMSTDETADALEISEGMVRTRLSRGCAALRRDLCEQVGVAESSAFRFLKPRCDRVVGNVLKRVMALLNGAGGLR